jgi:hypothetical protein
LEGVEKQNLPFRMIHFGSLNLKNAPRVAQRQAVVCDAIKAPGKRKMFDKGRGLLSMINCQSQR